MDEDSSFTPNSMAGTPPADFNLMDELLFDGFWLEATDGSDFCPNMDSVCADPEQESFPNLTAKSNFSSEGTLNNVEMDEFSRAQSQDDEAAATPLVSLTQSTRLWFGPNKNSICPMLVKKRLMQAIDHLKDSIIDKDVLIQIWIPVKRDGRQVLTTNDQPFSLNPHCKNLADYRYVSENYHFSAEAEAKEFFGLPGRVFLNRFPDWTPDVRFFKREEYPRVSHAQKHDVRGSLALPVFEHGSGVCLGVVEIVTTSQKVDFSPELENVCKALEAVNLKSFETPLPSNIKNPNEPYLDSLCEIKTVLKFICDEHKLPLAQTWAPCAWQHKRGCRQSDDDQMCCISTIDSACYVADEQVMGFCEACSGYHLLKGEGIVGKAFLSNSICFSEDVRTYSKTEYPLAHHARVFNLCAAGAIRLRSKNNERICDFVLEFFLPPNHKKADDPKSMLESFSIIVLEKCRSLRVITDEELAQDTLIGENYENSEWIGKGVSVLLANQEEESEKKSNEWNRFGMDLQHILENLEHNAEGSAKLSLTARQHSSTGAKTRSRKKLAKVKNTITLEVLRQHFAGSLKEAAMSIGVCPTTLKRICRQHGITRWPSRKIKKVGHSLRKLQVVIDSVKGADGSIQLDSFYNNFPQLVSPNAPGSCHPSIPNTDAHLQQVENQPDDNPLTTVPLSAPPGNHCPIISPLTTVPLSAPPDDSPLTTVPLSAPPDDSPLTTVPLSAPPVNHSSSATHCFSTKFKKSSLSAEKAGGKLKRAKSEAKLHEIRRDKTELLIGSNSHMNFGDDLAIESPPVKKKSNRAQNVDSLRVKATFGDENIRFRLQPQWGFKDLKEKVFRRFDIGNGRGFGLKYLDDDAEWVLLACDADFEECIDIHRSFNIQTIKLSISRASHLHHGSLSGNNDGSR